MVSPTEDEIHEVCNNIKSVKTLFNMLLTMKKKPE